MRQITAVSPNYPDAPLSFILCGDGFLVLFDDQKNPHPYGTGTIEGQNLIAHKHAEVTETFNIVG